jgi:hypothetical protein
MRLKHLQKHLKTLKKPLQNLRNIQIKPLQHMCKYVQHPDKRTRNIYLKKK